MDFEAWRCCHDDSRFCPDCGCPKRLGCARDRGWQHGMPAPEGYDTTDAEGCIPTRAALTPSGESA